MLQAAVVLLPVLLLHVDLPDTWLPFPPPVLATPHPTPPHPSCLLQLANEDAARDQHDPSNPLYALQLTPLRAAHWKGVAYVCADGDALDCVLAEEQKIRARAAKGIQGPRWHHMLPMARRLAACVLLALAEVHAQVRGACQGRVVLGGLCVGRGGSGGVGGEGREPLRGRQPLPLA